MTPLLQQSIRLLQLSSLELEVEVQAALESNPLLEETEKEEPALDNLESDYTLFRDFPKNRGDNFSGDDKTDHLLQKHLDMTLQQHLLWQMELTKFSLPELSIARTLIDAISEEGYLLTPLTEIQEHLNPKPEITQIESVLHRIQQFEPLGVGARHLAECLKLQLDALPTTTPYLDSAYLLVAEHLELLGKKDYKALQIKLNLKTPALREIIKLLQSLNPRPGTELLSKKCDYVTPDIIAFKKNGLLHVQLNSDILPKVRINTDYAALIKQGQLKEQLKEARSFVKGLEIRHETLLKVAKTIIEKQIDFLEQGEQGIKPLNLQDVATLVQLHESTISRITSKKYILTPRGIFELKYFFSNALPKMGTETSAKAIQSRIQKIIAEESSQAPLSDHKIKESLKTEGVEVARRTVTKYREALHIPSSSERKHLGLHLT